MAEHWPRAATTHPCRPRRATTRRARAERACARRKAETSGGPLPSARPSRRRDDSSRHAWRRARVPTAEASTIASAARFLVAASHLAPQYTTARPRRALGRREEGRLAAAQTPPQLRRVPSHAARGPRRRGSAERRLEGTSQPCARAVEKVSDQSSSPVNANGAAPRPATPERRRSGGTSSDQENARLRNRQFCDRISQRAAHLARFAMDACMPSTAVISRGKPLDHMRETRDDDFKHALCVRRLVAAALRRRGVRGRIARRREFHSVAWSGFARRRRSTPRAPPRRTAPPITLSAIAAPLSAAYRVRDVLRCARRLLVGPSSRPRRLRLCIEAFAQAEKAAFPPAGPRAEASPRAAAKAAVRRRAVTAGSRASARRAEGAPLSAAAAAAPPKRRRRSILCAH